MPTDSLLDHLEKTFADAYRKEIDQEENVWRSLPFFAATLALQLAGLAQVRDWVAGVSGPLLAVSTGLLALAGGATLAAILFLGFSVWPADFQYVGREPAFRDYAEAVRSAAARAPDAGTDQEIADMALRTVKAALLEQYATAADNNRVINQGRARWRTRAGLATLVSVFAVLVLVALVVVSNIHGHDRRSGTGSTRPGSASRAEPGSAQTEFGATASHASSAQGLVARPSDRAPSGGLGGGKP